MVYLCAAWWRQVKGLFTQQPPCLISAATTRNALTVPLPSWLHAHAGRTDPVTNAHRDYIATCIAAAMRLVHTKHLIHCNLTPVAIVLDAHAVSPDVAWLQGTPFSYFWAALACIDEPEVTVNSSTPRRRAR